MAAARELINQVPPHSGTKQWLIEHQSRHLSAELDWLDVLLQRLQSSLPAAAIEIKE
jgi:hypothetical protein